MLSIQWVVKKNPQPVILNFISQLGMFMFSHKQQDSRGMNTFKADCHFFIQIIR